MAFTSRQISLLEVCKTPKTLQDLGEFFDTGYYTVRKEIQLLISHGVIQETPFRDGKKKRYITTYNLDPDKVGTYNLSLANRSHAPIDFVNHSLSEEYFSAAAKSIRWVVSRLLAEHAAMIDAKTSEGIPFNDLVPDLNTLRNRFESMIKTVESYVDLMHQINDMPCWDNPEMLPILFGKANVNWDNVMKDCTELFERALNW